MNFILGNFFVITPLFYLKNMFLVFLFYLYENHGLIEPKFFLAYLKKLIGLKLSYLTLRLLTNSKSRKY